MANFQTTQMEPSKDSNIAGSVHTGFYNALFKPQTFEFLDEGVESKAVIPIGRCIPASCGIQASSLA